MCLQSSNSCDWLSSLAFAAGELLPQRVAGAAFERRSMCGNLATIRERCLFLDENQHEQSSEICYLLSDSACKA
jgi:hypothetical protein